MFDQSPKVFMGCVLMAMMLQATAAELPTSLEKAQKELDRLVPLMQGDYMNGRVTTITAIPKASDEMLIKATVEQLNQHPAPIKAWHTLKMEMLVDGGRQPRYLVAVVSSDQGDKIVVINKSKLSDGTHFARMYNCDAVFSSTQEGGTALIR